MIPHMAVIVQMAAGQCPAPPSDDVAKYSDEILGWIKWTVLALMTMSTCGSIGMLIWGRVTHHPKGARLGFDGIMIVLVGAVMYVTFPSIITTITGKC